MQLRVVPLGAGQDVGRSCVLVTIAGRNIMFDCGMHMGYNDERRFPDFQFISKTGQFTQAIDAVIITHFHLDHCGALPYFTEICGYHGPIYMTYPTKAICPILLEDYRKIMVERKGETNFFTSEDIKTCMRKVIPVNLHQTIRVDEEMEIRAYYAGHVLGAAMFYVRVGDESAVYTGDFNMTPDRHLGPAWIEKVRPDILITETTYATTIRDSKKSRERDFLKRVHDCVEKGGKVLIPVFALGRAQELCILIETYWDRMNLKVPVYFSAGLVERANYYYKLFINWTNEKIKKTFVQKNMFDFAHIKPFDKGLVDAPGPCVLFATPGMLHAGTALEVFKHWAGNEKNMVILPGYCVAGTVGNKLLAGKTQVDVDSKTTIDVRCQVKNLSFSAHADAKGIMQLIKMSEPRNVILVHGEKQKMEFLKGKINREFGIPTFDPPNGTTVDIPTRRTIPVDISVGLLKRHIAASHDAGADSHQENKRAKMPVTEVPIQGVVVLTGQQNIKLLEPGEAVSQLGIMEHKMSFSSSYNLRTSEDGESLVVCKEPSQIELSKLQPCRVHTLQALMKGLEGVQGVAFDGFEISVQSFRLKITDNAKAEIAWKYEDEHLAKQIITIVNKVIGS